MSRNSSSRPAFGPGHRKVSPSVATMLAVILLSLLVLGLGPGALSAQGAWSLGTLELSTSSPPSGPLQRTVRGPASLTSFGFVGGVGGVAFGNVAELGSGLSGDDLRLVYDRSQPDGRRLAVQVGAHRYPQALPDWIVVPAARYADSPYNACVSLFGERTTDDVYDIVFHPALLNTLLGLRTLQADILFFDMTQTWQLPRFEGRVVLGTGEADTESLDRGAADSLSQALDHGQFQSWVLTDVGESVRASLVAGKLVFRGRPYYYFWKSDREGYDRKWNLLYAQAETARRASNVAEYNRIASRINALEPEVIAVPAITDALRADWQALSRFNRPVSEAVTSLMWYAALFRAVKRDQPQIWDQFLSQLPATNEPAVTTPTRWPKPR